MKIAMVANDGKRLRRAPQRYTDADHAHDADQVSTCPSGIQAPDLVAPVELHAVLSLPESIPAGVNAAICCQALCPLLRYRYKYCQGSALSDHQT